MKKEFDHDIVQSLKSLPQSPLIDKHSYETKMQEALDSFITNMLHLSLDTYSKILMKEGDEELNKLVLPVDEEEFSKILNSVQSKWNRILDEMSELPQGVKHNFDEKVLRHILNQHEKFESDNLVASLGQCEKEARRIVDQLHVASDNWMNDDRFRAYSDVDALVNRHSHRAFCEGPAKNSSHVQFQFHRLRKDLYHRISYRVSNYRVLCLLSLIFGIVSSLRLRKLLVTSERLKVYWYDYSFGWIALTLLAANVALSTLIPDATLHSYLILFYSNLALLTIVIGVSVILTFRKWKPKVQRVWTAHDN
jgi:hypothetical protein